jgi:diguanylate cyclase (GGDEF)-like protein/PAS domain S-box-containing protein
MKNIETELQTSGESEQHIGRSLIGLVLVAVLPLLLFGSGAAWMVVEQKKEAVARELANTTQTLQVAVDRELLGQLELMQLLATDASLDKGSLVAFNDRARRAIQTHSVWRNAVLVDTKTHLIVASALPLPPPRTETSWPTEVDAVRKTRTIQIAGVLSAGKIVKEPSIYFLVPVLRNGEVPWVMVVPMDSNPFNGFFAAQRLSSSWTGAVLDKNLHIAGRSRDPARFVGKRATPTLADRILASEHGMFTALNQEGQTVYTVFSRSALTGWSVALGVPAAEVEGPIQQIILLWSAAGIVLIALGLVMTARVGRGILRSRTVYETALRESRAMVQDSLRDFSDLVRCLPVGVYRYRMLVGGGHRFEFVSERMCMQVGATQADIMRDPELAFGCFSPLDLPELIRANEAACETLQAFFWEGRVDLPDGQHWLRMESIPTKLPNGDILWNGTQQDITERRRAEESIRQLSAAVEQSPATVVITDVNANIEYVNPRFTQVTGYSLTEAIGQNPRMRQSKLTSPNTYVELWAKLSEGLAWQGELVNQRKNGEQFREEAHIAPIKDAHGATTHYVAVKVDITQRVHAEELLKQSEARIRSIFESAADSMFISDQQGHYQYVNQAAANMLGFGRDALLQMSIADITQEEDLTAVWQEFRQLLAAGTLRSEFRLRTKDGTIIPVDFHGNVLHDGSLLGACRDVTQRKQMEDQVRQLAFYDNLTGLANRRLFEDRLNQAILSGKRSGCYCALMFLDLDNFKPLNDVHGHKAGDILLIEVAKRMKACVRETDTVARFGGDEFVVLLVDLTGELSTSVNEAARVAEKIRRAIDEAIVLTLAGEDHASTLTTQHHCTASIGVAMIAASDVTAEDALRWADKAMYEAKEHGRNQVCFFQAGTHSTTNPERITDITQRVQS